MLDSPRILALFGGAALQGQERGNIEALAALKQHGCEVLCLVRDDEWNALIPPALEARGLRWQKVPYILNLRRGPFIVFVGCNLLAFAKANWAILRIARVFRPTHIHAFNQTFMLNFIIGILLLRRPLIYRAGDVPTVHNWFWRLTWSLVAAYTTQFVANSRYVASFLEKYGVAPEKIELIYNAPPRRVASPKRPQYPGARKICFIGQIGEHKGPHVLIDAFGEVASSFPDAHLLIAGRILPDWEGDKWARDLRDEAAKDPRLAGRVTFLGDVSDVDGLLEQCEWVVVPSMMPDSSPNVIVEAKQAGKASIVFPIGGLPELIEDGVDGLVCETATVPALVAALREYMDDPAKAADHGVAARRSMARLGIDRFGRKWLELYTRDGRPDAEITAARALPNE